MIKEPCKIYIRNCCEQSGKTTAELVLQILFSGIWIAFLVIWGMELNRNILNGHHYYVDSHYVAITGYLIALVLYIFICSKLAKVLFSAQTSGKSKLLATTDSVCWILLWPSFTYIFIDLINHFVPPY